MKRTTERKFITKMVKLIPGYTFPITIDIDHRDEIISAKQSANINSDFMSNNQGFKSRQEHQVHIEELIQDQRNREIFGD